MDEQSTTYRVGDALITRVTEQQFQLKTGKLFADLDPAVIQEHHAWLANGQVDAAAEHFVLNVNTWVVRVGGKVILVDTASGNHKDRPFSALFHQLDTPYLERLERAGVKPEEVDFVLLTHLHVDHVGWNTRLDNGRWVPTFPNARYVFSREDYEHYLKIDNDPEKGPANLGSFRDSVLPIVEAGLAQMVTGAARLDEHLAVEPSPGHTPCTIAIKFESRGERAVFCGDILHHALQVYRPHWNNFACANAANARTSRRRVLDDCAAGALLLPAHFGAPFACHIDRKGEGFVP